MNLKELKNILTNTYKKLNEHNLQEIRKDVKNILKKYNESDWKTYVKIGSSKYNRELIYTSPEYDLVIITWSKNQGCAIHNHPENGCTVKILQNNITEELYEPDTLKLKQMNTYNSNDIMYIDDSLGYHRMCNKNDNECVSLHVYAPGKYIPKFFEKK